MLRNGQRLSVILCAGLLAGCGSAVSSSNASSSSPSTVDITFASFFVNRYKVMQGEVKQFEKLHPTIHVTMVREPGSSDMITKLLTELAAGDPPNVVSQYGSTASELAANSGIVSLNSFMTKSHYNFTKQFYGDAVQVATVNGRVIGLPVDNDNYMIFYNKKLFQKYHVPYPTSNWTWADMLKTAKALNHPSQDNYGYLMPVGTSEGVTGRWEPFLWQLGGHVTNTAHTKATFNSADGIKVMQFYLDLVPYSDMAARSEYQNPFQSGHVAMTMTGSWNPVPFVKAGLNYGVVDLPSPYPGGPHTTKAAPDIMVMTKSTSAKEQASWELMQYLDNQQNAAQQAALGHLSFRGDVLQTSVYKKVMKQYPVFALFAANAKNARIGPRFPQYVNVSDDLGQAIEEVILHKMSSQEALDQAAQAADQQLTQPAQ